MPQLDLYAFYEQVYLLLISFSIFYFFILKILIAYFIRTISLRKNIENCNYNKKSEFYTFSNLM
jgi:hypothetical protein